jgi:site-specific recombinase XerC
MDISNALDLCCDQAIATRAANTARSYKNGLNVFAQFLEAKKVPLNASLETIQMDHFIRFPAWLAGQGYSKKTTGVYISSAKFFLNWLVINGTIRPDYTDTLRYEMAVKQIHQKREFRLPRTPDKGAVREYPGGSQKLAIPDEKRKTHSYAQFSCAVVPYFQRLPQ